MTNNTYTKLFALALVPSAGRESCEYIFKVFSMTRLGIKPQSTGYQVDALNRYTKRRWLFGVMVKGIAVSEGSLGFTSRAGQNRCCYQRLTAAAMFL